MPSRRGGWNISVLIMNQGFKIADYIFVSFYSFSSLVFLWRQSFPINVLSSPVQVPQYCTHFMWANSSSFSETNWENHEECLWKSCDCQYWSQFQIIIIAIYFHRAVVSHRIPLWGCELKVLCWLLLQFCKQVSGSKIHKA